MEPGKVFSRQELLDRIWGEEIVVDERTVDVHVSWLRGKLIDAGVTGDLIRTIYGAGYRFVLPSETPDASGSGLEQLGHVAH
jgi:two-component system, OmpR family, phosphate regulon response regulator PhoB